MLSLAELFFGHFSLFYLCSGTLNKEIAVIRLPHTSVTVGVKKAAGDEGRDDVCYTKHPVVEEITKNVVMASVKMFQM